MMGPRLRPSERLTGLVLMLLLGVAVGVRPPGWPLRALVFAAMILGLGLLSRTRRSRLGLLVRDFASVGMVLGIFLLLQPLVAGVNGHRWDTVFADLDTRWFGSLAGHWRNAFGRPAAFTDLVYAAYASFYFLPLAVAALARWRLGPARFEPIVFTLLLGFYLSYLGYFLWPTEGPRTPQAWEAARLGGGRLSDSIRAFLRCTEHTTLDAFPSGHTALSLLPALLATRPFPRVAPWLWVWALAIIFATVYISAHYVMDVLAGLLLVPVTLLASDPLARVLGRVDSRPGERS